MMTHYVGDDCPDGHQDEGGARMTDPERMTADELEALVAKVQKWEVLYWPSTVNQGCNHNDMIAVDVDADWTPDGPSVSGTDAHLIAAAPTLALRLAKVLRENKRLRAAVLDMLALARVSATNDTEIVRRGLAELEDSP